MFLAAGLLAIEIYKGVKGAHEFLHDFNSHVLQNARLKGVLEISPDDIRRIDSELHKIQDLQALLSKEHRWRLRQCEAIQKRLSQTTSNFDRPNLENDLKVLQNRITGIERDGRALNVKEATLENINTILQQAELVGDETARKLRKQGRVSEEELEALGVNILALSSKLEDEHKVTQTLLATMAREAEPSHPSLTSVGA